MDPRLIREIGRPQLASELLNDGLKRGGETDYQLVANKRQRRIVGLVSGTYREYRHTEFLHDLRTFTKGASLEVGSCWRDATTVEVNLTADIRVKMGREEDKTIIGLRAVNDIAGRSTVKVEQTVTRLACLNGLSWQPHGVRRQTYHQGHEERFKEKVRALWGAGIAGLEEGSSGIQTLLALEWDKELKRKVVRDPTAARAIDSLRRPIGCDPRYRPRKYETKESAKAREREHILGMTSSRAGQRPDYEPSAESPWRTTTLYDVVQDIGAAAVLAATRRERRKMEAVAGIVGERGIEGGSG